nr:CmcI family methyltransferase [Hylemonella gracilis]
MCGLDIDIRAHNHAAHAHLVTSGCYRVVFDTLVEDIPADLFIDRPRSPGDNPKMPVLALLTPWPARPALLGRNAGK